jgi:hypothetical protein
MSDDMGIPDDVLVEAFGNTAVWYPSFREGTLIRAQVIAQWAREVALREAEEAVLSPYKGTVNTAGMSYEDAASWEAADVAAAAIRALRSGTADTNPKGDDHG